MIFSLCLETTKIFYNVTSIFYISAIESFIPAVQFQHPKKEHYIKIILIPRRHYTHVAYILYICHLLLFFILNKYGDVTLNTWNTFRLNQWVNIDIGGDVCVRTREGCSARIYYMIYIYGIQGTLLTTHAEPLVIHKSISHWYQGGWVEALCHWGKKIICLYVVSGYTKQ